MNRQVTWRLAFFLFRAPERVFFSFPFSFFPSRAGLPLRPHPRTRASCGGREAVGGMIVIVIVKTLSFVCFSPCLQVKSPESERLGGQSRSGILGYTGGPVSRYPACTVDRWRERGEGGVQVRNAARWTTVTVPSSTPLLYTYCTVRQRVASWQTERPNNEGGTHAHVDDDHTCLLTTVFSVRFAVRSVSLYSSKHCTSYLSFCG